MIEQVFWQAERECKAKEPPADAPLPDAVDVAVIGAGLTGLSAARTLAKGGASVAVFETNTIAYGASGRNGGQVSVGAKRGPDGWAKEYGKELAAQLWKASMDSVQFVEDLVKQEKIDCGWTRCGLYEACFKSEHFGHLAEWQKYMAETFDYKLDLVPPVHQKEELGSDLYHGGMVDEFAGMLNPYLYTRGLAAAALKAKAQIFENTEVQALTPTVDGWSVTTSRGTRQGERRLRGDQRLHRRRHPGVQAPRRPRGQPHHRHRAAGQGPGAERHPQAPHRLRLEEDALLLHALGGRPARLRRPGQVAPHQRAAERRDPAQADGPVLPAARRARRSSTPGTGRSA